MLFLSVDFGTSAVKTALVTEQGKILHHNTVSYPYILLPNEKVELSPNELLQAFQTSVRSFDDSLLSKIDFLCYDTFSPSPVFLDDTGSLVYPNIITHMDRRSRKQSAELCKLIGKDAYLEIAGLYPFAGGCSAMTLMWFVHNEPSILKHTFRIGHLPTFIHHWLTGQWAVDLVNASMMGVYETTCQSGWSDSIIRALSFSPDWFGEIVTPGKLHGTLRAETAKILGLKEGVPVAMGTNDAAAAHLGAGNTKAGQIMNTAGSSEMISILTDVPKTHAKYYLRNAALPGLWQIYATTAGGFAVDWFYKEFCKELSKEEFFTYLAECIASGEMGEVTFQPYLTGDRQSLRKKTAAWNGLTLGATRDQMLLSMLASMQGVLRQTITLAEETVPLDHTIKITGGMVNDTYLQLKQRTIPGFEFQFVDDCPIRGNVELVKHYL